MSEAVRLGGTPCTTLKTGSFRVVAVVADADAGGFTLLEFPLFSFEPPLPPKGQLGTSGKRLV